MSTNAPEAHEVGGEGPFTHWTPIDPSGLPPSGGWFSQGGRVDMADLGLMFVSGQMALDDQGDLVGGGDLRTQTQQVFANLGRVLADQGATFDDVVNIRTFLTDMSEISQYGAVRARYLTGTPPTSTTIQVSRLVHPDALVEVDIVVVIAAQPASGGRGAEAGS